MIRTVIIGLGMQGRKYARMLWNNDVSAMELTGVCVRSDASASWADAELKGVRIYRSEDEMFADSGNFDAVIVATPHKAHYDTVMRAFEKGKNVFCEKPLSTELYQAEEMIRCAGNNTFAVMFHLRAVGKYRWIKEKIDSGELGHIERVLFESSGYFRTKHYHDSSSWRSTIDGEGGGALINQGQHLLDLWQWYFGMPDSIFADIETGKYKDGDVEDEATLFMKYLIDEEIEYIRYADSREYINTADVNTGEKLEYSAERFRMEDNTDPYIAMFRNFAEHIERGTPLIAEGKSGINALKLCCMAYKYR